MKQQEILDYNKRCAEFLGLKRGWWIHQEKPLTEDKKQWWDIDGKTFLGTTIYYDKDLKFYSDWNWIKSVLEKISSLNEDDFSDETQQAFENLLDLSLFSSKESVCESINNFIKTEATKQQNNFLMKNYQ